jgi:hypothetical protein
MHDISTVLAAITEIRCAAEPAWAVLQASKTASGGYWHSPVATPISCRGGAETVQQKKEISINHTVEHCAAAFVFETPIAWTCCCWQLRPAGILLLVDRNTGFCTTRFEPCSEGQAGATAATALLTTVRGCFSPCTCYSWHTARSPEVRPK